MAFCNRCGQDNPDDARFCASCGAEVAGEAAPLSAYEGGLIRDAGVLADPFPRLIARFIDGVILFLASMVLWLAGFSPFDVDLTDEFGFRSFFNGRLVVIGLVGALYEVTLVALRGQTIGKRLMNIKVVTTRGEDPPGWGPALLRYFSTFAMGFIPFLGVIDSLWLLWDKDKQCLHDKAAQTLVVRANR